VSNLVNDLMPKESQVITKTPTTRAKTAQKDKPIKIFRN
jgi:hypothetical protein